MKPTINDLKDKKIYIGATSSFPQNSLAMLIEMLGEDENVVMISDAISKKTSGAIVVTDKRVIYVAKTWIGTTEKVSFGFDKITSVTASNGLLLGNLTIECSGDDFYVSSLQKGVSDLIKSKIDEMVSIFKNNSNKSSSTSINDLEKLAELKVKGIITEEEFSAKKKQILGL